MSLPGSFPAVFAFNAAFLALLALAVPRPRFQAYTFIAIFLFLGFCGKFWVHGVLGFSFVEPIGAFDASAPAWDRALWLAAAGAMGMAAARSIELFYHRSHVITDLAAVVRQAPGWFTRHRHAVWAVVLAAVVGLNAWNVVAAFYQIGVNPRVVLPARLNVPIAWLINIGFALVVAVLVHWELQQARAGALYAAIVEALACSVSTLSRSAYILHAGSYLFAALERSRELRLLLRPQWRLRLVAALAVGFVVAILAVQWLRASVYFAPATGPGVVTAQAAGESYFVQLLRQVPFLVVHRWVGLEGMLAVTAHSGTSLGLFADALMESPKVGGAGLYQRIAGSAYAPSQQFTFLTLPGVLAVLAYSGSLVVVFLGAATVCALLMATEAFAARSTGNPYLLAVAGAAMAYVASNLNFPYLAAVFMAELWVTLALIRLAYRP